MRRKGLFLAEVAISVLMLFNLSWGQCPEDPNDRGECDTLNVICLDSDQTPGAGPWFVRFPYLVTHDQTEIADSVAGFVIPIAWTHTNPSAFCSASAYWNATSALWVYPDFGRSIFRHIVEGTDTLMHNRMGHLGDDFMGGEWDTRILELDSDLGYARMSAIATGSQDQLWWEGDRVLFATLTLVIEDTMHVCMDTTFWPPTGEFLFSRADAVTYVPRSNLPYCFWIGPAQIRVTSPNGGEVWIVGENHDITWVSENFDGEFVDVEFSTDGGGSWTPVAQDHPNDGVYSWLIPDSTSEQCRVKVSDADDGDPYDESDNDFSIIYTSYFSIDAEPDTQWVKQGGTTEYQVILTSFFGFNSPCTLTLEGLPPQATFEFDPPVVTPTDTSLLTVVVDSLTPLDLYELTIIGTEQAKQIADTTEVLLYVIASLNRKPELTLPGPQTVYAGLQIAFPVVAIDPDTLDTLILAKTGVGDFPCYPRVSPVVCYFQWTTTADDTLNSPYTVMFTVEDGRDSTDTGVVEITVLPYSVPPSQMPGDANGDGMVEVSDIVFILNYMFQGGPPSNPPAAMDINGDCFVGLSDLIWLINYLYRGGPPPQIRCLPGDFNYDGYVNLLDPPYFVDYMAYGGPAPVSMRSTDVNSDCFINVVDLVYEIKYLLRGGAAPEPGCVAPALAGAEEPLAPGMAEVGFSEKRYDPASRVNWMSVFAGFDDPVQGVELSITFDPDEVSLLPPTLTSRTEDLGLFYNLQRGKLVVGLLDLEGVNFIRPGDGPILNLRFVPADPTSFDLTSIQIEKATLVNSEAQEMTEQLVK
ncbi:MAG: dockerin type I domain-containing protein [Candidatus Zixiibacteriota bacterium]